MGNALSDHRRTKPPHGPVRHLVHSLEATHTLQRALQVGAVATGESEESVRLRALVELHGQRAGPASRHAQCCRDLVDLLWTRWDNHGDPRELAACIEVQTELVDMHSHDQPERAATCNDLAALLKELHSVTNELAPLTDSVDLFRDAVLRLPRAHQERALFCHNLGCALSLLVGVAQDASLLLEAMKAHQEALSLRPQGHPARAATCKDLAVARILHRKQTGDATHLEAAVRLMREAVAATPDDDPDRVEFCHQLSIALRKHGEHLCDAAMLHEAIVYGEEVLGARPRGHEYRAAACHSVALTLRTYFSYTGDTALLDRAIELGREVLALRPPGHSARASACNHVAITLRERFEQTGEMALADEAIVLHEEVLALRLIGHPDRHFACADLAITLWRHSDQIENFPMLDRAIALTREVLELRPRGHRGRAAACELLAGVLGSLLAQTEDVALVHEPISLQREVLELRARDHPERALACDNLAAALIRGYEMLGTDAGDVDALDEAALLLEESLHLSLPNNPARWCSYVWLAKLANLRNDWAKVLEHLHSILTSPSYSNVKAVLDTTVYIINHIEVGELSLSETHTLLALYGLAIGLMNLTVISAITPSAQLHNIRSAGTLGLGAVVLSISADDLSTGIHLLERARGMLWSQRLQMRDPQLAQVPPQYVQKLQNLLHDANASSLVHGEAAEDAWDAAARDRLHAQRGQIRHVVQEIRALPGLGNFMQGPDAGTLLSTASSHPVVLLLVDGSGCHAIIISSPYVPIAHIALPELDEDTLSELNFAGLTSQHRGGSMDSTSIERGPMKVSKALSPAHARLAKLWRAIVKPIITHLGLSKSVGRARPRIHWCPTGAFTFVPIHAAGIYTGPDRECCSDYFVSSYTPTLTALLRAQQGQRMISTAEISLLGIAAENAHNSTMPRLRHVVSEVAETTGMVKNTGATIKSNADGSLAHSDVLAWFQSANIVHLACHGIQNPKDPHKSRFCLSTGDITVSELMSMELKNASIAFLSACETAKGDAEHADEVVHLAATMLFAGFKSIVATMWAMGDADGPFVARRFYQTLFEGPTVYLDLVPYALDDAVVALRKGGALPERWATFIHMGA